MEIRTLEQLVQPDSHVGHFTPLGFTTDRVKAPESSLRYVQSMIADCDLILAVPEFVRDQFEICRALHTYGYFRYEFFTAVAQRVYFTLEAALGARFLAHLPNGIELEKGNKKATEKKLLVLQPAHYSELTDKLRQGWRLKGRPKYGGDGKEKEFDGSAASLLAWARAERLLYGQRNKEIEQILLRFRNAAAHPHVPFLTGPNKSADDIRDVAEIINHLWGHDTPGGRLYGTLPEYVVMAMQWAEGEGRAQRQPGHWKEVRVWADLDRLRAEPNHDGGLWFLLEVARSEPSLMSWLPDFDTTVYPTRLLWQGASREDVVTAWEQYEAEGGCPLLRDWRDRLFLVRHEDGGFEACRSPEQFLELPADRRDVIGRRWAIFRADHPGDVLTSLQMALTGAKREPPVWEAGLGDYACWSDAAAKLNELEGAR